MVLEIATFEIIADREKDFERGVAQARAVFARAKGCRSMSLRKVVERPSTYLLMVEWDNIESHNIGFRQSADFMVWRALVGQFFASPPVVEHSEAVTLQDDT